MLINTSIDTFLAEQRRTRRPMTVKKKLDGAVDKSSADQDFHKLDATVHNL